MSPYKFDPDDVLKNSNKQNEFTMQDVYSDPEYVGMKELIQDVIEQDTVSPFMKKLINTRRSAKELLDMQQSRLLEKQIDIEGYKRSQAYSPDGDSLKISDPELGDINARIVDKDNYFDTAEGSLATVLKSPFKTRTQIRSVARLLGKDPGSVTEEDIINVANYQWQQQRNMFSGEEFTPYDPDTIYDTPEDYDQPFDIAYKVVGYDKYDRALVEVINPSTGRSVSFDMANNPYLNTAYDFYKSIDTEKNRQRANDFANNQELLLESVIESLDRDGRLKESIDIIKATAYQSAARALQYGPNWLVDKEKWQEIANPETGQMLADAWAGVKTSTRRAFTEGMLQASNLWEEGDHTGAILGWAKQMDRLFAESATQMGLMIGTGVATSFIPGLNVGVAGKLAAAYLSASLAGVDKTLMTMEEFKQNNSGQSMSGQQVAGAFVVNTLTLIPEVLLLGMNLKAVMPKGIVDKLFAPSRLTPKFQSGPIASRLKAIGVSTIGEMIQEGPFEESTKNWLARDRSENETFDQYLFNTEVAQAGVIGGMMGGAMSAVFGGITLPLASFKFSQSTKNAKRNVEYMKTHNVSQQPIDESKQHLYQEAIDNWNPNFKSPQEFQASIEDLLKVRGDGRVSAHIIHQAERKASEAVIAMIEGAQGEQANLDAFIEVMGIKTKEEVLESIIYFSDMNAARFHLDNNGKSIDKNALLAEAEKMKELAKKLGVSEDLVNDFYYADSASTKDAGFVALHTKWSKIGYETYTSQINSLQERIEESLNEKEIKELQDSQRNIFAAMLNLFTNQSTKMDRITQGTKDIATTDGRLRRVINFPASDGFNPGHHGKFTIFAADILRYTPSEPGGLLKVTNHIFRDIEEMATRMHELVSSVPILKEFTESLPSLEEVRNQRETFVTTLDGAKARISDSYASDTKSKKQSRYRKPDILAKYLLSMNTRTDFGEDKSGQIDKDVRDIILNLQTASKETLEEVRNYIKNVFKGEDWRRKRALRRLNEIEASRERGGKFQSMMKSFETEAKGEIEAFIKDNLHDEEGVAETPLKLFLENENLTYQAVQDFIEVAKVYRDLLVDSTADKNSKFYTDATEAFKHAEEKLIAKANELKEDNKVEVKSESIPERLQGENQPIVKASFEPDKGIKEKTKPKQVDKRLKEVIIEKLLKAQKIADKWIKEALFFDTETDFIANKIHQIGYTVKGVSKTINIKWVGTKEEYVEASREKQIKADGYMDFEDIQKKNSEPGTKETLSEAILEMKKDFVTNNAKMIVGFNNLKFDNVQVVNQLITEQTEAETKFKKSPVDSNKQALNRATEALEWFYGLTYTNSKIEPVNEDTSQKSTTGDLRMLLADTFSNLKGSSRQYFQGRLGEFAKLFNINTKELAAHHAQGDSMMTKGIVEALITLDTKDANHISLVAENMEFHRKKEQILTDVITKDKATKSDKVKQAKETRKKIQERVTKSIAEETKTVDELYSIYDTGEVTTNPYDAVKSNLTTIIKVIGSKEAKKSTSVHNLSAWTNLATKVNKDINNLLKKDPNNKELLKQQKQASEALKMLEDLRDKQIFLEIDFDTAKGAAHSIARVSREIERDGGINTLEEATLYSMILNRIEKQVNNLKKGKKVSSDMMKKLFKLVDDTQSILTKKTEDLVLREEGKGKTTTISSDTLSTQGLIPNSPLRFTYGRHQGKSIEFTSLHQAFEAFKNGYFSEETYLASKQEEEGKGWVDLTKTTKIKRTKQAAARLADIMVAAYKQSPYQAYLLLNTHYSNLQLGEEFKDYGYKEIYEQALERAREQIRKDHKEYEKAYKREFAFDNFYETLNNSFDILDSFEPGKLTQPLFSGPLLDAKGRVIEESNFIIRKLIDNKLLAEGIELEGESLFNGFINTDEGIYKLMDQLRYVKPTNLVSAINMIQRAGSMLTNQQINALQEIDSRLFNEDGAAMSILPSLRTTATGEDIGSPGHALNKMLVNSPHMRLLYRFISTPNKRGHLVYNKHVLLAVDQAVHEWVATTNMTELFSPARRETLGAYFGYRSSQIEGLETQLRDITTKHGVPTNVILDDLGRVIMDTLGFKEGSDSTRNLTDYNRIRKGLGMFALEYITAMGWMETTTLNLEEHYKEQLVLSEVSEEDIGRRTDLFVKKLGIVTQDGRNQKPKEIKLVKIKKEDKRKTNKEIDEARERFHNSYKEAFILETKKENRPLLEPVQKDVEAVVNTGGINTVSARAQEVLNTLRRQEYKLDMDIVDDIIDNLDNIKVYLGYVENVDNDPDLSYDQKRSQRGINLSIDMQLNQLVEMAEVNRNNPDQGWYFDWFVAVNQRFHINSNHVNMQQNKSLQRFLVLPKSTEREFDYTNENTKLTSYYAIAQAFDALGTKEEINRFGEVILSLPYSTIKDLKALVLAGDETALKKAFKDANKNLEIGGIENLGQILHVFKHLEDYHNSKGKKFKSTLVAEFDSTTSGYLIRTLQMPTRELLDPNIGVFLKDSSLTSLDVHGESQSAYIRQENRNLNQLKGTPGFFDVYQTVGASVSEKLANLNLDSDTKRLDAFNGGVLEAEFATTIFKQMVDALPTAEAVTRGNKQIVETISHAIRELVKDPTMVFNYAAGKNTVITKVTNAIKEDFISEYIKIQNHLSLDENNSLDSYLKTIDKTEHTRIKAIYETMVLFEGYFDAFKADRTSKGIKVNSKESLIEAIKLRSTSNIILKVEGTTRTKDSTGNTLVVGEERLMSLDAMFKALLEPTYGNFMWDGLNEKFGYHGKFNTAMNETFRDMFTMFEFAYEYEINKLIKSKGEEATLRDITRAEEKKILDKIAILFPSMRTPFSTYLDDRLMVMNTAIVPGEDKAHQVLNLTETVDDSGHSHVSNTVEHGNAVKFRAAALAGAVLPIHMLDASVMHSLIQAYPDVMPVHDAVIVAAMDGGKVAKLYNEYSFLVNKEFNLFETLVEDYDTKLDYFEEHYSKTAEYEEAFGSHLTRIIPSPFGEDLKIKEEGKKERTKTVTDLKKELDTLLNQNNVNRDTLLNQVTEIANMSGPESTFSTNQVTDPFLRSLLRNMKTNQITDILGSSYLTFDSLSELNQVLLDANANTSDRIKLIDSLQAMAKARNNLVEEDSYISHVKDLLSRINLEGIQDYVVEYTNEVGFNYGKIDTGTKKITIGLESSTQSQTLDPISKLSVFSDKSAVEIYAHEVIHGALHFAFSNLKSFKVYKEVNQLQELHRAASDIITWEDFMPEKGTYDPSLEKEYKAHAINTWKYIFANPYNVKHLTGVQEFAAFGLTHKGVMKKLQNEQLVTRERKNEPFINRLLSLVKTILDVAFNGAKLRELLPAAHEVFKGNRKLRQKETMYEELLRLSENLSNANHRAVNSLLRHPIRLAESLFSLAETLRLKGNKMLSPRLKKLSNFVDEFGLETKWMPNLHQGKWHNNIKPFLGLALTPFSESRRKSFNLWAGNHLRLQHEGLVQTLFKEMTEQDTQTSRLMKVAAKVRQVEQVSMEIENALMAQLREEFGRELSDIEANSLSYVLLKTDLSSLLEVEEGSTKSNIDEIISLIKDPLKLDRKITDLEMKINSVPKANYFRNQALGLAMYMTKGVTTYAQMLNVDNIIRSAEADLDMHQYFALKEQIDQLATLYALRMSDNTYKQVITTLDRSALNTYLRTHKQLITETTETGTVIDPEDNTVFSKFRPQQYVKGQIKNIGRTSMDIKVDLISNQSELAKQGYKLVERLGNDKVRGAETALYKRTLMTPNRRDGAAIMPTGAHMIGEALEKSIYQAYMNTEFREDLEHREQAMTKHFNRARREHEKMTALMESKILTEQELLDMVSNYTPVMDNRNIVSDYVHVIPHALREEHTKQEMDGITVLGKMFSNRHIQASSEMMNEKLFDFLKNDMEVNRDPHTNKNIYQGVEYVKLKENSGVKFLDDAWKFIPPDFKKMAKELPDGLWVRRDWILDLVGTPQASITNIKPIQVMPYKMQHVIKLGEIFMRWAAGKAKRNIIMLIPQVLTRNIISNLNISIASGNNPAKVISRTISNAKALVDYLDTKKELNRIDFKKRIGTATKTELSKVNMLKAKLEHNPVKPLIDKGMYQAIIEELDMKNMEGAGEFIRILGDTKVVDKMPKFMKKAATQVFMEKGSFLYDLMYTLTSYSDFVSRATEYQLRMEKKGVPTKWEYYKNASGKRMKRITSAWQKYEDDVTNDVWHAFINYDKPQSTVEQYANDVGLVMFTKYAKRIQHFITKTAIENPMGVMMTLFGLHSFGFIETIYEHQFLLKSWPNLVYNPVTETIPNAVVPIWIQYLFGMRTFKMI